MTPDDPLFRAAGQVRRLLARYADRQPDEFARAAGRLADAQLVVGLAHRRIEKARRHGWHLAAQALRAELTTAVRALQGQIGCFLAVSTAGETGGRRGEPESPTVRTVVDELRQLREEFDHVEVKPDKAVICARTDRVVLEDVDLGPFEVVLDVKRLGERVDAGCFDCVALDPNPASSSEDTTHPHVQSNSLCAGDAAAPISQALRQGRIFDAFCLVRSVLQTYNSHSPYVALDDWSGNPCPDCGRSVGSDGFYYCEACGGDFCDDCVGRCDLCEESACDGCLERDPVSRQRCCPACRHTCDQCHRTVDADSFDAAAELCPECARAVEPEDEEDDDQTVEGVEPESDPDPLTTETDDHEQPQPLAEPQPDLEPATLADAATAGPAAAA